MAKVFSWELKIKFHLLIAKDS